MRRRADRGLYFELPRELGEDRGRRPAAAVADLAPRAIVATARPHGAAAADLRAAGAPVAADWSHVTEPPPPRGRSGRQTVTITGQGAEGYATRRGTRSSTAQRHQAIRRHERDGFRPDRVAMYAVMLGVMLMLAAAVSAHAAVLAHHALTH